MADFAPAYAATEANEGFPGYVNDPNDPGGETVAGLTRRDNPTFSGWSVVDTITAQLGPTGLASQVNARLRLEATFRGACRDWYKTHYWDRVALDAEPSQRLANSVYDFAVNAGPTVSLEVLRQALHAAREQFERAGLDDA